MSVALLCAHLINDDNVLGVKARLLQQLNLCIPAHVVWRELQNCMGFHNLAGQPPALGDAQDCAKMDGLTPGRMECSCNFSQVGLRVQRAHGKCPGNVQP